MDIFKKSSVISTHYLVYGAPQALREYLIKNKAKKLLFIAHPLEIDSNRSYFEITKKGKVEIKNISCLRTKTPLFNYLIEFFLTLYWVFFSKGKHDLFIGVDNLNTLAGIILRFFRKVDKVIYYTIDYSPQRFQNKLLNSFYHKIDNLCVKYADVVWNVSSRIAEGRLKTKGLGFLKKQKVVPIGVWPERIKRRRFEEIKGHQLLFLGHLLEKQGVQKVIDAVLAIIKEIPDFLFLIIGGGEYESILREKVNKMRLNKYVTFTGWIKEREEIDKLISESACAIAPYDPKKAGFTYYADPTKIKDYLSAGLPVILTNVPYNAEEIEKNECGVVVKYTKENIAQAVIKILKEQNTLKKYRENALNYAKQFDWNKIFSKCLSQI